jgi:diguanylate cyclase (GGDEF)-like protein/PAS domain S-box-containing protein
MVLVQEGAATLDRQGNLLTCNTRLAEMLGLSAAELTGRGFATFVQAEDMDRWRIALGTLEPQKVRRLEAVLVTSGGQSLEASVGICGVGGPGPLAALLTVSDVAIQRQRMRQLEMMLRKLEEQRDELEQAVTTDNITGAYTSGAISEVLSPELAYGRRHGETVSVLLADIDRFKLVNDTYGHAFGDEVLKEFCDRCRGAIRTTDYLIRYGGDEFVIVLPRTDARGACAVAERIWASVHVKPFGRGVHAVPVTTSIGAATAPPGEDITPEELVKRADAALYQVKRRGRDGVASWRPGTPEAERDTGQA